MGLHVVVAKFVDKMSVLYSVV